MIYGPHPAAHGFVADRSIITNARNHLGRRFVLNVDLKDFFPGITRKRIYARLRAEPYGFHSRVANLIAALATNRFGRLPQGSPSSPIIANIVAAGLDADLANLCGSLGCRYTRYVDDITVSTSRSEFPPDVARYPNASGTSQVVIGDRMSQIISDHGFRINYSKCRLQNHWTRQMCTGLVVNSSRAPSPPRYYIRRLRSLVDHWKKHGWQHAAEILQSKDNRKRLESRKELLDHVVGRIHYIEAVRGDGDRISERLLSTVRSLPSGY